MRPLADILGEEIKTHTQRKDHVKTGEKTIRPITLKLGCKLFWRDEFLWTFYGKEMEKQDWIEG